MWGFLVFISDSYSQIMKVMGKIHYGLYGGDFDASFHLEDGN